VAGINAVGNYDLTDERKRPDKARHSSASQQDLKKNEETASVSSCVPRSFPYYQFERRGRVCL